MNKERESNEDNLEKLKNERLSYKNFKMELNEAILSIIFIILTFSIAYQMIDLNSFNYQTNLANLFGAGDKSQSFENVISLFFNLNEV